MCGSPPIFIDASKSVDDATHRGLHCLQQIETHTRCRVICDWSGVWVVSCERSRVWVWVEHRRIGKVFSVHHLQLPQQPLALCEKLHDECHELIPSRLQCGYEGQGQSVRRDNDVEEGGKEGELEDYERESQPPACAAGGGILPGWGLRRRLTWWRRRRWDQPRPPCTE